MILALIREQDAPRIKLFDSLESLRNSLDLDEYTKLDYPPNLMYFPSSSIYIFEGNLLEL